MSFPVNRYSKTVHKHKNLFSWKQANLPQNPFFCEFYSILNLFSHKKQCIAIDKLRCWSLTSLELCFLFTPDKKKMTLSHPLLVCLWTSFFSAAHAVPQALPLLKTPPPQAVPRTLPLFKEGVRRSREGVRKEEELEYDKAGREFTCTSRDLSLKGSRWGN